MYWLSFLIRFLLSIKKCHLPTHWAHAKDLLTQLHFNLATSVCMFWKDQCLYFSIVGCVSFTKVVQLVTIKLDHTFMSMPFYYYVYCSLLSGGIVLIMFDREYAFFSNGPRTSSKDVMGMVLITPYFDCHTRLNLWSEHCMYSLISLW